MHILEIFSTAETGSEAVRRSWWLFPVSPSHVSEKESDDIVGESCALNQEISF